MQATPYANPIGRVDASVSGIDSSANALNPIELQSVSQNYNNYGKAANHYGMGQNFRTIDKETTNGSLIDAKNKQGLPQDNEAPSS